MWLALALPAALACDTDPSSVAALDALVAPNGLEPIGPGAVFVVHRYGEGAIGPVRIITWPGEQDVSSTRYDLSEQWAVIVPDAPLEIGHTYVYTADTLYSDVEFTVDDVPQASLAPTPTPVRRDLEAEVLRVDPACPAEAAPTSLVRYRLCADAPLVVMIAGDAAPPASTGLDELPSPVAVASGDEISWASDLGAGAAQSMWIGSFDASGRFQGWVNDEVVMPDAGGIQLDQVAGDTGPTSTTPTAFSSCPEAPVDWVTVNAAVCAEWPATGRECDAGPDPRLAGDCACRGTDAMALGWGWLAVIGVGFRRRR